MTFEGRLILYRMGLHCSQQWGDALAQYTPASHPPDPAAPFEVDAWHDALEIVDDLRSGRPVKKKWRVAKQVCRFCEQGDIPIRSSVSDAMVHMDATGHKLCERFNHDKR